MPTPIRQTKADLLARRVDINAELRKFRSKYDKPGAVEVPGDLARIESLAADDEIESSSSGPRPATLPSYDRVMRVGRDQHQYRAPAERGHDEPSFLTDLYCAGAGRPAANARLERHGRESRSTIRGREAGDRFRRGVRFRAAAIFVRPVREFARAGRLLANLCARLPLRHRHGPECAPVDDVDQTAVQATEGGAIGNQDPTTRCWRCRWSPSPDMWTRPGRALNAVRWSAVAVLRSGR